MKTRLFYSLAVLLVIALGLCSRKFGAALPPFVALHFGDALWAAMVYLGFRFLFPHKPLSLSLVFCLCFSFLIEFSQLYQADWINNIRANTLGALVLGRGFLLMDLLRYGAGALGAFFVDAFIRRSQQHQLRLN